MTVFSVFQSTERGAVLVGSRFGSSWGRMSINMVRELQTSHRWPTKNRSDIGLGVEYSLARGNKPTVLQRVNRLSLRHAFCTTPHQWGRSRHDKRNLVPGCVVSLVPVHASMLPRDDTCPLHW